MEVSRPTSVAPAVEATRWAAIASTLALIALGLAWELWLAPLRPGGSWWALKVLVLCIPLNGLLRRRLYTYRWTSLLVWPFVAEAAVRVRDGGLNMPLALAQIALCLSLFAACAVHVRLRLRKESA